MREVDGLDVRCIARLFVTSTDPDVVTSIMVFIPEMIWHGGEVKNLPLRRIYAVLMDCFDFSDPSPAITPQLRDVACLGARAFAHIEHQGRCITHCEEHKQDSWKALCAKHTPLSSTDCGADPDLATVLCMVDMTFGYDIGFPWGKVKMSPSHHA